MILTGCKGDEAQSIIINWQNNRAISVSVPLKLLDRVPKDSIQAFIQLRRENANEMSILGDKKIVGDNLVFTPLIPFSKGTSYGIFLRDDKIGRVDIPLPDEKDPPSITAMYPTRDSLPENLLKLYIVFTHQMREGNSLKHISLLDDNNDTMHNVFLELQPELWNDERTVLTLWLDPGRIKRELIPNQEMGNPLQTGKKYALTVSPDFEDAQGRKLNRIFRKQFTVISRDSVSPDLRGWNIKIPSSGTMLPLQIATGESLDYFLLKETIRISNEDGKTVPGSVSLSDKETIIQFTPSQEWAAGQYSVHVASHLEDLAGNNLNKVFDRDVSTKVSVPDKRFYERSFTIK